MPAIIKRGVRSLESNQAVIDREAWFKARLLLLRLTLHPMVVGIGSRSCADARTRSNFPVVGDLSVPHQVRIPGCVPYRRWPSPSAVRPGAGWYREKGTRMCATADSDRALFQSRALEARAPGHSAAPHLYKFPAELVWARVGRPHPRLRIAAASGGRAMRRPRVR